jgi:hypothetical protein|tara:strand:- start:384 stop:569 length:186 start_codon:yes stop_codon:yes gene_type:complete
MGKKLDPMTWAVVREDTPTIPTFRLWLDCTDCGLFMSEADADNHARLLRSLEEQMVAEGCA